MGANSPHCAPEQRNPLTRGISLLLHSYCIITCNSRVLIGKEAINRQHKQAINRQILHSFELIISSIFFKQILVQK